jgi:hypothetical protein
MQDGTMFKQTMSEGLAEHNRETDTYPFPFTMLVITGYHLSVADPVAETICSIIAITITIARVRCVDSIVRDHRR